MKKITDIDERVSYFKELPDKEKATLPTYRELFKAAIGLHTASNPSEAIDFYQLGMKFTNGTNVDLEDAQFNLLKKACDSNPAGWISHIQAQVAMKIRKSEG